MASARAQNVQFDLLDLPVIVDMGERKMGELSQLEICVILKNRPFHQVSCK